MLSKYGYLKLRGYIKANSAASSQVSQDISIAKAYGKDNGERIQPLRDLKNDFSHNQRHHLIAYGLLRGLPYKKIEPKCGPYNHPNVAKIHKIIKHHVHWKEWQTWNFDYIRNLIGESK